MFDAHERAARSRSAPRARILTLLGALLLVGGLWTPARVQGDDATAPRATAPQARVPVRVVADKLVLSCDLSTSARRIPANLFVELENPCGLQLHNRAAGGLRAENRDGSTRPITIHLPGMGLRVERREHGPEKVYEDFTKFHSAEIGENALVGTIGREVLSKYHIELNLAEGWMGFSGARAVDPELPTLTAEQRLVDLSLVNGLVWCPVTLASGKPMAMALGTARVDSIVDRRISEQMKKPAGDVGAVMLGGIDVHQYVALRPEDLVQVHPDGALGMLGLGFLQSMRVEIDHANRRLILEPTKKPAFPEPDLMFFRARVEDEGDAVEAFLEAHPKTRLAPEAARLLIDLRLDEEAEPEVFGKAVQWVADTSAKDLRTTQLLALMEALAEEGHSEQELAAGRVAIESGRDDRYPDSVHKVHGRMGRLYLNKGNDTEAFRSLLSAVFEMPEDGLVNLHLGKLYEKQGRVRRAFSRYVQAVIQPESGAAALAGLRRLQPKMDGEEPFSVDLIERMIGGKVESFGAATKYVPKTEPQRTVLVEFFTNGNFRGAIGGALGNEGLLSHFEPEHVAFIAYHLPVPSMDPMVNEISQVVATDRGIRAPNEHRIDGVMRGPGAGRVRHKERIYQILRGGIIQRLAQPTQYRIEIEAALEDGQLDGTVTVTGPETFGLELHAVLVEKGVLAPGKSKVVVHRMVARAALLDPKQGAPFAAGDDGSMRTKVKASLADITAANKAWLEKLSAEGGGGGTPLSMEIDPEQVMLVAYLRDWQGNVLQAARLDPDGVKKPNPDDDLLGDGAAGAEEDE